MAAALGVAMVRPWDKPVEDEGRHAAERREAGHRIHTVVVEVPSAGAEHTDRLSDVIEDVEAAGWVFSQAATVTWTLRAGPCLLLVFRAAQ